MNRWKYGISFAEESPMTAPLPLAGDLYANLEKATSYGYKAIEFHTRESYRFDMRKYKDTVQRCEGVVCCLATGRMCTQGGYSLLDEDAGRLQKAMDGMQEYIDVAKEIDADIILGWAKGNVPIAGDRLTSLRLLAERMKKLNDYAAERSVRIMVEAINHYETNIFNTAEEILSFLYENELDNCYVHLDTYHMGLEETDPYKAIRLCGNKLGYFHVADNTRRYPGSGQFDFVKILQALSDIQYSGYITVECIPAPDRDTAAKLAIEHLKKCAAIVEQKYIGE